MQPVSELLTMGGAWITVSVILKADGGQNHVCSSVAPLQRTALSIIAGAQSFYDFRGSIWESSQTHAHLHDFFYARRI